MKRYVVTGAAGFAGMNLVEELIKNNHHVIAVVRPESAHNERLKGLSEIEVIKCDMDSYNKLPELIGEDCDGFFHHAWAGKRYEFDVQYSNVDYAIKAVEAAAALKCKRIVITGSQAEYGAVKDEIILEDRIPNPFCPYGAAKVAACYLTKEVSKQLQIEWVWGRIFSLYGKYEPPGRMMSDLIPMLRKNEEVKLSSCRQYWDYLYSSDGASALLALMEKGKSGEIYNVANGDCKPLKYFVEEAKETLKSKSTIRFYEDPNPFVNLNVSVEKIKKDTGWKPNVKFGEGILIY